MASVIVIAMLLLGLLFVGFIVLLVVVGVQSAKAERQRVEGVQAWAAWHRWYLSHGDAQVPWRDRVEYRRFRIQRLLNGDIGGLRASISDCTYETQRSTTDANGQSQTTTVVHPIVVLTVQLTGVRPDMALAERGLGSRMARALGKAQQLETGYAEFDRRFTMAAADPWGAREYLSPALIQAQLSGQIPPWSLRGGELLIVVNGALRAESLDYHVWTLRYLAELLGHRF
ncbi:hypothetical protein J4573_39930 [Actinomadura barringtoniae]|uniref:Uncharacterized protein n=1 Tax=Actinomadura barringtoniae TaxID=1427535 RepID=A0A939T547_9ACTN|nr:hypothetical protein [Actinomadura barringtoniae]MBO2453321.1 hypothetical protein [Actinomadura barringtoniae]